MRLFSLTSHEFSQNRQSIVRKFLPQARPVCHEFNKLYRLWQESALLFCNETAEEYLWREENRWNPLESLLKHLESCELCNAPRWRWGPLKAIGKPTIKLQIINPDHIINENRQPSAQDGNEGT